MCVWLCVCVRASSFSSGPKSGQGDIFVFALLVMFIFLVGGLETQKYMEHGAASSRPELVRPRSEAANRCGRREVGPLAAASEMRLPPAY